MRTIKFRGQKESTRDWVYGYLSTYDCIDVEIKDDTVGYLSFDEYLVIPETVGQFTGLFDLTHKEIFEGDILANVYSGSNDEHHNIYVCEYANELAKFRFVSPLDGKEKENEDVSKLVIIGNKFDDERLLKINNCPSADFKLGEPNGICWGTGHYECDECVYYRPDFHLDKLYREWVMTPKHISFRNLK